MSDKAAAKNDGGRCTPPPQDLKFVNDYYGYNTLGQDSSSFAMIDTVSSISLCDESWTATPSSKVVEAMHYLTAVMGGYDAEALSEACLRLTEIIKHADGEVLQLLYNRDVVGVLLKMMEALPSHSATQQAGCEALQECNEQAELRGILEDHHAYRYVLVAMKNHSGDPHLQSKALCALASLAATVLSDTGLKESKAYLPILSALKTYHDDLDVQRGGLLALANVLKTDAYVTCNLTLQGEHKVVIDSMRSHASSPLVVAHGCKALRSLAITDVGLSVLLGSDEVLVLVVAALQRFGEVEEVVCAACEVIEVLASSESGPLSFSVDVNRLRVVDHLVTVIERYTEVLDIQTHAFSALGYLCSLPDVMLEESSMEPWLRLLQDALTNHGRESALQEATCRCLAHLLEINPYLHLGIGDGQNQIPLHNHVWITLLNQITMLHQVEGGDPRVYKAVTLAIYYLVVDDESLQGLLLEKGAAVAVLEGMREFLVEPTRNERCVEFGCRALIGLIMSNNLENEKQPHPLGSPVDSDHSPVGGQSPSLPEGLKEAFSVEVQARRQLEEAGVAQELTRILDDFLHDPEVLVEAFGVIACLADVAFQKAVVSRSMYRQVLQAVEKHHNHAVLVESALEVIIILSQNEGMTTMLNEVDAIGTTVSVMKKHIVSSSIQRKGCLLINLVCEEEYLGSQAQCTAIAKVVINALSRWRTEPEVQIEALACTQKLCEKSAMMSEALVHGDVHLLLFNMLYREHEEVGGDMQVDGENDGGFIFQVGTDILYTLGCARDFKQQMLTTAIKDGLLEGVSVLVDIGADVNGGEEADAPICLAVQSRNKLMVDFLLQQGVHNVHRALSIACELGLDDIIGLLLQHIAVDRNGDVVNLSGLELQTIKPRWILPSLGVRNHSVHQRARSLGHLKEMLRRKSVSCLTDNTLYALRDGPKSGVGVEETDSGVVSSNAKLVSKPKELLSPVIAVNEDAVRKRSWSNESIGSRKMSGSSQKLSRSSRSSADSVTFPSPAANAASTNHRRSQLDPPELQSTPGGVNPDELMQKLIEVQTTPPKSTPRRKLATSSSLTHLVFEPSLSPISGTPTHTLRRQILHEDSGIENTETIHAVRLLSPTDHDRELFSSPDHDRELLSPPGNDRHRDSFDSTESVEGHSSRHTPKRRHQHRKRMITGARQLPFSTVDYYKQRSSSDRSEAPSDVPSAVENFSISPRLVFKRLSMWKKRGRKKVSVASTDSMSRSDSPIPVVYQRGDYYFSNEDSLSRESTPAHSSNLVSPRSSIVAGDEIGPLPTWRSPERTDADDSRTSSGGPQRGNLSASLKERTPSSGSMSSSINTPLNTSRRSSIDIPTYFRMMRDSRDETDFEPIPEEPPTLLTRPNLVKVLDMSSNRLGSLAALVEGRDIVVQRLKGLQRLDLKQNCLSRLPPEMMEELKQLIFINLSCNGFTLFPREAVMSPALTELDISANKITQVPKLPKLPSLTKLNLNSNLLGEFPSEFNGAALPRLRVLNLRSNQISHVPNVSSGLSDLEELNISKNQIQELPELFLASLVSLKTLDASRNELSAIPGEVAEDLVHLQSLKVGHNLLGKAEADFNNFITLAPVLLSVDATENGLSTLPPPYAWKSRGIKDIRMNGNRISRLDLSDSGRFWPQLECLYLGQNKLKEIPREIGNIRTLSCLDISHNKEIRNLPNEMGDLKHLFMLNLQGLKNLSLDPSLLKGSTKAIISFLKSKHHKSVPYYHMKMMMVGGAGKGKTTLLHQLLQEKSSNFPRSNVATLGVSVKRWNYQHRTGMMYHIKCWDFAGQVEFYSTHQCFLTCRSLYVVVYNMSHGLKELDNLLSWLLNIQARAPSSPIIIVGTHVDKIKPAEFHDRKRQMRTKIAEMVRKPGFPTDISFAEVSCFDDKLVGDLRRKIKELIDSAKLRGQKIMGGQVPLNYLVLEKVIQKESEHMVKARCRFPVLRASRLRELMDENKHLQKMDKAELDQAIHFLHECGILLHYNDLQSKLSELYFLEPEWLCMLMGNIITVSEVNSFITPEGTMSVKMIPHLLKEPKFPAEFIPEYTRLLERFEVVLRQTPDTLLITSCLPRERPTAIHLPPATPGSQIIRRYSMCYIPPGFWPRLVARLIAFPRRALHKSQYTSPQLKVWFGGVYSFWSEQAFFLIELLESKTNTFDIIVPATKLGTKLLCAVVDNVEALIDEWFPGLRDLDILSGDELVLPMSRCPLCPISSEPHCFKLKDLLKVALTADEVQCPKHKGTVLLEHLAPDIVISDLEPKYKLSPEEFSLSESSSNMLGKGGFGEVYKATCRGQPVAVKIFSQKTAEINNTTPNHLIRQEVSILSQLEHPNVISMVAVCLRPKPMLLLEYAELGSLKSLYPYSNVSMPLKHRIAMQVASALAFLHKNNIIYRDLKPDNVLLFSLSIIAQVNAKLSDYGIACYATESGLIQPSGTTGCKAPELLKSNSTYNEKVDIYSYGLMLYVMMTNGHKPFEELNAGYEVDKAIEEGRTIKDIEHFGCPPWPDMQDLINHCLQYVPNQRPKAQAVFDRLCSTEFVSLKRTISVEYDHSVETFAIRNFTDKHRVRNVEVWIASSLGSQTMLSTMNLSQKNASLQGMMMMQNATVFSMAAMDPSLVVMGTNTGVISVYDSSERKLKHHLKQLDDSVLCLTYFKSPTEGAYYLSAGLANGKLAIYDQYMLQIPGADPHLAELGTGPIRSIKRLHGSLYVSCGAEVVVIRISDFKEQRRWKAIEDCNSFLTCLEVGLDCVWTAHNRSPRIQLWDVEDGKLRGTLHCDMIMKELFPGVTLDPHDARVTSMMLQPPPHSVLWVGLGSGYLLLINASTRTPLVATRRQMAAIRCIRSVKALVTDKPVHLILTGGFGFRQRPGYEVPCKGTPETYGSILVWDSIMPRIKNTYDNIQKQQEPYR